MRISRRQFGTGAVAAAAAATLAGPTTAVADRRPWPPRGRKPNIVFIIADDLGYGDLGCYGHPSVATPHVDRLAREGVRLTHAYANSPICSPTRVAWATGRYPGRLSAGNREPIDEQRLEKDGVSPAEPTLPRYLKDAGYETALFGKWHLGYPAVPENQHPDFSPILSGFDEFWGLLDGAADYFTHSAWGPTPDDYKLFHGTTATATPSKVEPAPDVEGYLTDLIADRAVEYLQRRERDGDPFYLGVHFTAPHWPWEDRDDQAESARLTSPDVWNGGFSQFHWDGGSLETYYEMVRILDEGVGRILRELKRRDLEDDTLVIFVSDNGGERFSYNWPFTGGKPQLTEGGIRVPAIVRWPGKIRPGRVSEQVLATFDLTASVLACAGVTPRTDRPLDGENVLAVLTGHAREHERRLFWRFRGSAATGEPNGAVRDGDLKYLRTADGSEALYNLRTDPHEQANLARRQPADLARLRDAWNAWNSELVPY